MRVRWILNAVELEILFRVDSQRRNARAGWVQFLSNFLSVENIQRIGDSEVYLTGEFEVSAE